jgi:hypothetical protein
MRWLIPLLALVLVAACGGSSENSSGDSSDNAYEALNAHRKELIDELLRLDPGVCVNEESAFEGGEVMLHAEGIREEVSRTSLEWAQVIIEVCKERDIWLGD